MIIEAGLEDNYVAFGNVSRPQAIELTRKAQVLFLPLNIADNAKGRIPGKLFENLRAKRPILCLGPKGSDVSNIIKTTNTGGSFEYDDYEGIKKFLLEIFDKFLQNKNILNVENIEQYTVENQTKILAGYLDELLKD